MDPRWPGAGGYRSGYTGRFGSCGEVSIRDSQVVHAHDTLFVIDRERFRLALQQAEAVVENRRATWEQAVRDMDRYRKLDDVR
jgi:multidrug resistance efflux pump